MSVLEKVLEFVSETARKTKDFKEYSLSD
jgi:hypothetical protein